jgi:hypothetical protein
MKALFLLFAFISAAVGAPLTPADDIQAAIDKAGPNSLVQLGPGRFELWATLVVPPRFRLIGSGIGITTLARAGDYRYAMIQNAQTGGDWTTIEDLTLDCAGVSFMGVNLFGSHNTVRRLQICNHVSPMQPDGRQRQESFAVLLTTPDTATGQQPVSDCLIDECLVNDFKGNYDGGLVIAGVAMAEGTIRNSRYYGSTTTEAYDFIGCMGASVIEGCWMENVAVGIYTEGLPGPMTVRNCTFKNIRGSAIRVNLQRPQSSLTVRGCDIHLAGGSALVTVNNPDKLSRLDFFGNSISGTEARCQLEGATWKRRKVEKAAKTVAGPVTIEGDWKRALK